MKKKPIVRLVLLAAVFAAGIYAGRGGREPAMPPHDNTSSMGKAVTWTCPMHPQVQQPEFGQCPLCGMDLVPAEGSESAAAAREITLSPHAAALAGIETAPVERRFVTRTVRMTGKITYDETRIREITLLTEGQVERLFVNYDGIPVRKGDHLAEIYSPEVYTAFRELLVAARSASSSSSVEAARSKLHLLGVSTEQVEQALASNQAPKTFTVYSPWDGVLTRKPGNEGSWVHRGDLLAEITDASRVWALLDAYESDLDLVHYGQQVQLDVEALPGQPLTGYVSFIPPELDEATRSVKVRLNVPNRDLSLKPGMFVRGRLETKPLDRGRELAPKLSGKWISPMHPEVVKDGPGACDVCGMALVPAEDLGFVAQAGGEEIPPLVIPASAPLLTGKRAVVYVEDSSRPGTFEGREVVLGPRAGDTYIIQSGLHEGERVAARGAMKIDSTLQVQARPSMMSHPGEGSKADISEAPHPLLEHYLAIQEALAADDPHAAMTVAAAARKADLSPEASKPLEKIAGTHALEEQRQAFHELSLYLLSHHPNRPEGIEKAFCPMAFDDAGAEWLQRGAQIANPYFGAEMLRCGVIRK